MRCAILVGDLVCSDLVLL